MKHAVAVPALGAAGEFLVARDDVAGDGVLEAVILWERLSRRDRFRAQKGAPTTQGDGDGLVNRAVGVAGFEFVERVRRWGDDGVGGVGAVVDEAAAGRTTDDLAISRWKFLEVADGDGRV